MKKKFFTLISVYFLLFSCASWRSENFSEYTAIPDEIKELSGRPNISLSLTRYDIYENGKKVEKEPNREEEKKLLDQMKTLYGESKLFNLVDEDSPSKDITVEISVTERFQSNTAMTFLTAFTLYLIPRKTQRTFVFNTKFIDKKKQLLGMVEKMESIVTWHQFFMLFAMPFATASDARDGIINDLTQYTITEAHQNGYFVELSE
ncbi:MAG: hypothetical protein CME66_00975 [Halobacteriovoraceae bacterium]|nr:hypothetical protein [Halobacteriovoraceae bacterium]